MILAIKTLMTMKLRLILLMIILVMITLMMTIIIIIIIIIILIIIIIIIIIIMMMMIMIILMMATMMIKRMHACFTYLCLIRNDLINMFKQNILPMEIMMIIMMASSNGNISLVTGPLWGEFTGHRWIFITKASDAEFWCFLWSAPEQTVE